ncbi:MAG: signal peptidase I [Candidatus Methanomethylicia archaeon]
MNYSRILKNSKIKDYIMMAILLITVLFAYNILQIVLNTKVPIGVVSSSSMEPSLKKGDYVICIGVKAENIEVGDIIIFNLPYKSNIIHRVVNKTKDSNGNWRFLTKGDNNNSPDENPYNIETWIREKDIVGKVVLKIPYIGWITLIAHESPIISLIIFLLILIVITVPWCKEERRKGKR